MLRSAAKEHQSSRKGKTKRGCFFVRELHECSRMIGTADYMGELLVVNYECENSSAFEIRIAEHRYIYAKLGH